MFDRKIILDKHKQGSIWGRGEGVRCKKISLLYADSKFTENIPRHPPPTHTPRKTQTSLAPNPSRKNCLHVK